MTSPKPDPQNEERDLGLGSRVTSNTATRFLNQDGSFNVRREGLPWLQSLSIFHAFLTLPAWKFYGLLALGYVGTNLLFGFAYFLLGPTAIIGAHDGAMSDRLLEAFFFSVHTLATIGYGVMSPNGFVANILVTIEALLGLLGLAMATGLSFARFSRPSARIIFSTKAVVAPYRGGTGFMFRIINARKSQLIEVEVKVVLGMMERRDGRLVRNFYPLDLERTVSVFFPLHWTVVHPIREGSPLAGLTDTELREADAEFVILLTGTDESFSQTVHARSSYKGHDVVYGAKFSDMFLPSEDGRPTIDVRRLHDIEPADLPPAIPRSAATP